MDIGDATNEFNDWELLQPNSDPESTPINSIGSVNSFDEIDYGGLIPANYFSLDALNHYGKVLDDNKSAKSDNPSWIHPGLEENPNRYLNKDLGEIWSDDCKCNDLEGNENENEKKQVGFEIIGEIVEHKVEDAEDLANLYSDSSGIELAFEKVNDYVENSGVGSEGNVVLRNDLEVLGQEKHENEVIGKEGEFTNGNEINNSGEIEKRGVVWWKMPMELLKYCVLKMSPAWIISVAAAVMGFLILGRRLYKIKKTRGLEIKVTVDDKKVSLVMSRAARLNEAFSVVKRVPVIWPSLPGVGVTTWPAITTLR